MTAIDYAKPIGWWCRVCRADWGDGCQCHHIDGMHIPRFTPLPKPEPGASEPDDDTVCVDGGPVPAWRAGSRFAYRVDFAGDFTCESPLGRRKCEAETLADAVLWVAEGKDSP